jgi:hypothetical protein
MSGAANAMPVLIIATLVQSNDADDFNTARERATREIMKSPSGEATAFDRSDARLVKKSENRSQECGQET